ncbi:cysteine proteinase inhibitor-like [Coffea eugenioides]|uniref:cysteine proteinase inhibitor-like n=1 Tax=Coffea eugenioides TaxID=49369 RepID=UPI000F605570|nr:cysteine proteinase inhibitor-like [Coffea eugenioides]XP_027176723.1 cysteine proteinase inhibitor-like [Coffea eugenioides]
MKISTGTSLLCFLCLFGAVSVISESCEEKGFIKMKESGSVLGGSHGYRGDQSNGEIESIGRFAVQEHNKKENALLEFGRVIKAKEQVVAGKLYHLTLEAIDAGKKQIYEAKVWVKPWMNFKKLEEFRHTIDIPSFTTSDLGLNQGHLKKP